MSDHETGEAQRIEEIRKRRNEFDFYKLGQMSQDIRDLLSALDASRAALVTAEREREDHARRCVEANNELSCISRMLDGDAGITDFDLSFPLARGVNDLRADRDALAAEVQTLRAELAWQPIETAPRDREVMLWWPYWSKRPTIGYWKIDRWIAENALVDSTDAFLSDGPTHWQPLPTRGRSSGDGVPC